MEINERHKLTEATLAAFAGRVVVPAYNRKSLAPAIVHIGVGGFHRAHQAVYLDDLASQDITKIGDQVARICTDGSDRMPKFLLPSLAEALEQGRPHQLLTLAAAGWIRYLFACGGQGLHKQIPRMKDCTYL